MAKIMVKSRMFGIILLSLIYLVLSNHFLCTMPFRRFDCAADQECMTNNRKQPYLCGDSKGLFRKIGIWVESGRRQRK